MGHNLAYVFNELQCVLGIGGVAAGCVRQPPLSVALLLTAIGEKSLL